MADKPQKRASESETKNIGATKPHFSLSQADVVLIEKLRRRYQSLALKKDEDSPADINKSEIVRAGIYALKDLPDNQFYKVIEALERLSRGRPPQK